MVGRLTSELFVASVVYIKNFTILYEFGDADLGLDPQVYSAFYLCYYLLQECGIIHLDVYVTQHMQLTKCVFDVLFLWHFSTIFGFDLSIAQVPCPLIHQDVFHTCPAPIVMCETSHFLHRFAREPHVEYVLFVETVGWYMRTNCMFTGLKYKIVHLLGLVADISIEANFRKISRLEACAVKTVVVLCLVLLLFYEQCVRVEQFRRLYEESFVILRNALVFVVIVCLLLGCQ